MESLPEREHAIHRWLRACNIQPDSLQLMVGDASFRRYFRLKTKDQTFVVMDAPPAKENCRPFVAISAALGKMNLQTPEILHADLEQGFLLLTDFGDHTYLATLTQANADLLYGEALDALAILQSCRQVDKHVVPPFTADFMRQEWKLHKEWVWKLIGLASYDKENELDANYEIIVNSAVNQPQVFMHRDYHSANLMVISKNKVGILDFQDAFIGPVTYDLVSLLRDCYIDWPQEKVQQLALSYLKRLQKRGELIEVKDQDFLRWFDYMGMQRHLKAMLTFARKQVRDQQSRYLVYLPRTMNYLLEVSAQYPELKNMHDYLQSIIKPGVERILK